MSEVVVLRPTMVFWVFLASQLPEKDRPTLKILQTNCTAYVIKKYQDPDQTLAEIEKHYELMFRYEICRWLGSEARNRIEQSFLDFIYCFKLEFHAHLVVLDPSSQQGNYLLQLRPTMNLLHWLNSAVADQQELADVMEDVSLAQIAENATVVIKHFNTPSEIKPFMQSYYSYLFETAMSRITSQSNQWPKIRSFEDFCFYFSIEIHTQLISFAS